MSLPNPVNCPNAMHVLLVEDDAVLSDGIARNLTNHGMVVDVVSNGRDADLALQRRDIAVVVLDIGLPGIDGYEVARRIKKNPALSHIRLVAHTGYGSPEDRKRAMDAGFDAHLVKPAELPDLEQALKG